MGTIDTHWYEANHLLAEKNVKKCSRNEVILYPAKVCPMQAAWLLG